jgi:hypothetical protein
VLTREVLRKLSKESIDLITDPESWWNEATELQNCLKVDKYGMPDNK